MKINSILFILTITSLNSLKIKIIDEDFINVKIGNPPTSLKLLIDPTAPFSYIFSDFESTTTIKIDEGKFLNEFGKFEGEWQNDYFYITDDGIFNFRLRYFKVLKTNSPLNVDGVFSLGDSSFYPDANIYNILSQIKISFPNFHKVMSYDKQRSLLILGELPEPDYSNPVTFPLFEGRKESGTFVNLTKISFIKKNNRRQIDYINIGDIAKLGILPVIIAPRYKINYLNNNYFPRIKSPTSYMNKISNPEKFFSDIYISEENDNLLTEMIFDKIAYKFDFVEKKNGKFRSNIRLGDNEFNPIDYWYIGMDLLYIDRADFNFEKGTVKLYSSKAYNITSNKLLYLFNMVLVSVLVGIIFAYLLRRFLAKKKQKDIEKGQELVEL